MRLHLHSGVYLLLLWAGVGLDGVQAQNLIVNGGFEAPVVSFDTTLAEPTDTSITGWTATKGDGSGSNYLNINGGSNGWIPDTPFGNQSVQLDTLGGTGTFTVGNAISQTLNIASAGSYRLSFAMNSETGGSSTQDTIFQVVLTGAASVTQSFTIAQAGASNNWIDQFLNFTVVTPGSLTIRFNDISTSDRNGSLDNVTLFPVPETSTLVTGLILAFWLAVQVCRRSARSLPVAPSV